MRNEKLRHVFVTILFLFIYVCGLNSIIHAEAREEFHQKYTVKSGIPVSVKNVNGNIKVSAWNEDYVDVFAVKKSRKGEDDLAKVEIRVTEDGKLSIETHRVAKRDHVSVSFTVKVPENVLVERIKTTNGSVNIERTKGDTYVKSTNGSIKVSDADGVIDAHTTNGDIRLTGITGIKRAESTNGDIDVSVSDIENDVSVTTTNGSIELYIPEDLNADINLNTTNGRIKTRGLQLIVNEVSKKRVRGRIGSGGNRLNIKSTNGRITLYAL